MIAPRVCTTEAEVRALLRDHLKELIADGQVVRVNWGAGGHHVTGFVESYIPLGSPDHDEEDADALFIEMCAPRGYGGYVMHVPEIIRLEVLASQRMTPELGYRQMLEAEKSAGLPRS